MLFSFLFSDTGSKRFLNSTIFILGGGGGCRLIVKGALLQEGQDGPKSLT